MTVPAWLYFVTVLPLAALAGAGVVCIWQWSQIPVTYGSHAAPRTDIDQASANVTRAREKLAASLDQLSDASRRELVELGPDPEDDSDDWPAIIRGPLDDEDQGAAIVLGPDYPAPVPELLDELPRADAKDAPTSAVAGYELALAAAAAARCMSSRIPAPVLPAAVPFRPEYGDPDPAVDDVGPPLARPYIDELPHVPVANPAGLDSQGRERHPAAPVPFSGGPASAGPAPASGWPATVTVPGSEA